MVTEITNLKQLPYKTYTAWLLKSKDNVKPEDEGYLYISSSPKMIILFTEFIEEIHGKVVKEVINNV